MKEDILNQLIEKAFRNIACPLEGRGVYTELQNVINAAYNLGQGQYEMKNKLNLAMSGLGINEIE